MSFQAMGESPRHFRERQKVADAEQRRAAKMDLSAEAQLAAFLRRRKRAKTKKEPAR